METGTNNPPPLLVVRKGSPVNLIAFGVFFVALVVYVTTLAPGLLWGGGDFATFQTRIYTGELRGDIWGHPLWVILARPFTWLPIRDIAYRANLSSAVFSALALVFVFCAAWDLTRSIGATLLATGALLVSHFFWLFAVTSKVYALSELMLAVCIFLLLRWRRAEHDTALYVFAAIYGLSLFNHLVTATAAIGFLGYILLVVGQRAPRPWRTWWIAGMCFLLGIAPYAGLMAGAAASQNVAGLWPVFLASFVRTMTSSTALIIGLGLGIVLLAYQFPVTILAGAFGWLSMWKHDRAVATLLTFLLLGNIAFVLTLAEPSSGGEYVWNLQYYFPSYIVFALWIAMGLNALSLLWSRTRQHTFVAGVLCIGVPIIVYAIAPIVARPFLDNLPGFRQVGNRDNLTYVLSPWKQNETGARVFGESILSALPRDSTLFADYSIWAVVNYLQVVEGARLDVRLVELPGAGAGQQLPLILNQRSSGDLFLGDVNRYYDLAEIETVFTIVPAGPIYRLIPK